MTVVLALAALVPAHAADVLMLGDGDTEVSAQATLRAAGHTVTYVGSYKDWDPMVDPTDGHEVVVWFQGNAYNSIDDAVDDALMKFVRAGGVLIRTEWAATELTDAQIDAELPVDATGDYAYDGSTWTVGDPSHPVASAIPDGRFVLGAYATTVATTDAHVVYWNEYGHAMWSERPQEDGLQIHLNHGGTYKQDAPIDDFLALLEATVSYAGDQSNVSGGGPTGPSGTGSPSDDPTGSGTDAPCDDSEEGTDDEADAGTSSASCSTMGTGMGSFTLALTLLGLRRRR